MDDWLLLFKPYRIRGRAVVLSIITDVKRSWVQRRRSGARDQIHLILKCDITFTQQFYNMYLLLVDSNKKNKTVIKLFFLI